VKRLKKFGVQGVARKAKELPRLDSSQEKKNEKKRCPTTLTREKSKNPKGTKRVWNELNNAELGVKNSQNILQQRA